MPISPLYEWAETELTLEVRVQLQGASRSKADVFATDCMLKVNSPPYLLILDLFGEVDDSHSVVTLMPDCVLFQLRKKGSGGIWGQLEAAADKEEVLVRRNASIDRAHAKLEAARKARLERKQKEEREAIDRQIELDRKKRMEIEQRKKQELEDERTKIASWQQGMAGGGAAEKLGGDESDYESDPEEEGGKEVDRTVEDRPMPDHPDYYGKGWQRPQGNGSGAAAGAKARPWREEADDEEEGDTAAAAAAARTKGDSDSEAELPLGAVAGASSFRPLPPPRIRLQPVQVEFTKLETNHLPAREHREEEIRLYKKSIKDKGQLEDSTDVADRQPVFLKDKGDALYKQGNFRGAINAYTRALELDPDQANPALWSNRSACHLRLGEHESCVDDCSRALDILLQRLPRLESGAAVEEAEAVRRQLVKAYARRGQARVALGCLAEAEADYLEALRYDASNQALQSDLEEVRAAMQPADATTLRLRGNARFQAKDFDGAVQAFSLLLSMHPAAVPASERMAAFGNRAASYLVLERYEEAVNDCTAALDMHLAAMRAAQQAPQAQGSDVEKEPGSRESAGTGTAEAGAGAGAVVVEVPESSAAGPLHQWLQGLQGAWPFEAAQAAGACKLLARRGAALAHLRRYGGSALDYGSAAMLAGLAGDGARQGMLESDAARVKALLAEGGGGSTTGCSVPSLP